MSADPHAHLELARRCVRGDEAARREFFEEHRRRVHVVLFRVLGTNRPMEDLAQEAFLEIFGSLGRYRGEASLGTWVDRIATRVAYRWLRNRKTPPLRLVASEEPASADDPERTVWLRQVAARLYAVLETMDPKYRIAYALHVIDGRPVDEVATLMEASLVATKTRVWRARRQVERRARRDACLAEYLGASK